jgi:hypothetical protein
MAEDESISNTRLKLEEASLLGSGIRKCGRCIRERGNPTLFKDLRNKSVKENQSPSDVYMVVSSTLIIRYDIIGSAPENEEELRVQF